MANGCFFVYLTNQFDSSGRVIQQTEVDGGTYQFKWTPTANTNQDHFIVSAGGTGGGGFGGGVLIRDTGCWGPNGFSRSDSNCQESYLPLLRWGPKLPPGVQQVLRIPWVYVGMGGGATVGGGNALAGRNCGCQ